MYWKKNISKTLKKEGVDYALDHSKNRKEMSFVRVVDLNELDKEKLVDNALEEIVDFHDNELESQDDERLFRVYIDSIQLLNTKFLHNIKVYSRKTNISLTYCVNVANEARDLSPSFIFFDKVFELHEIADNLPRTIGTVKVLKSQNIDSFTAGETWGLAEDRAFFFGLEKHHNISFRDIDVTDIL